MGDLDSPKIGWFLQGVQAQQYCTTALPAPSCVHQHNQWLPVAGQALSSSSVALPHRSHV